MPFTLSHVALALPFAGTRLPLGALAMGTVSPDLPLYLPVGVSYAQTHSTAGALEFAVPLAALAYLLWLHAVRPSLAELLPQWLATRLPVDWARPNQRPARHTLRVIDVFAAGAALVIGVLSHLLLDDLTHSGRWGGDAIASATAGWPSPITPTVMQVGLSALGLAVIGVWAVVRLWRAPVTTVDRCASRAVRRLYWGSLVGCLVIVTGAIVGAEGAPGSVSGWFPLAVEVFVLTVAPAVGCTLLSAAWVSASRAEPTPTTSE